MVAYSFQAMFREPIIQRVKCQTIRADRRRHARPGERLQLFTGMRTRYCQKIIPDPICLALETILIDVGLDGIVGIVVNGKALDLQAIGSLAVADGFRTETGETAVHNMGRFWLNNHGPGVFSGVIIRWEP
jgi:hypothetical protein